MDKSKPLIISFLDLAKAFDTVNNKILIGKLERYGIRGKTLELMSYLSNRKEIVKLEDKRCTEKEIQTGVPQGTILAPLLFIERLRLSGRVLDSGTANPSGRLESWPYSQ